MYKKIFVSFIMIFIFLSIVCNSFVLADVYETGDKVVITDRNGYVTGIEDKKNGLNETGNIIMLVACSFFLFSIGLAFFASVNSNKMDEKTSNALIILAFIIGIPSLLISLFFGFMDTQI